MEEVESHHIGDVEIVQRLDYANPKYAFGLACERVNQPAETPQKATL
jgi:hypothetical protein